MRRNPRRSSRLRWQAAAVMTVAALGVAACSSSSSSSGSGAGSGGGSSSSALTASAPGITPTQILIGSHQPLTGPAAPGYSEIAPAANAYFSYVNAHGGVFGRKIVYKYIDDGYDPTKTASVVRQLVLQNSVYAIFNGLGTPTHLAAVSFLNAQKIPDVFVASGCECWNDPTKYPQTFGWQLDYVREGKILGQYVKQHFAGKKIGYFFQNDEFGQDGVKGLDYEIPSSSVVSRQSYNPTNVNIGAQVAALRASGAQVVVSFSIPAFTALLKLNTLKLGFNPTLVVSNVGSDPITLSGLLEAFAKQGGATVNGNQLTTGIITDGYLPTLGNTSNSWISLFSKVHQQYDAKAPFDGNVLYGMSVGYAFVQAMLKAGRNPTRADLVSAVNGGLPQGAVVAPYAYSSSDHNGVTGAYMGTVKNGVLVQQGPVLTTDDSASGAVSTYSGSEEQAPANGIPSP
jgi:ABC-type branched-subunit amino acid transport system substrate-binding protein